MREEEGRGEGGGEEKEGAGEEGKEEEMGELDKRM